MLNGFMKFAGVFISVGPQNSHNIVKRLREFRRLLQWHGDTLQGLLTSATLHIPHP